MITSHHSFSTRIFLNPPLAAHATAAKPAAGDVTPPENLREFWWFLRSGRGQVQSLAPQSWRRDESSREASATQLSPRGTSGPASS